MSPMSSISAVILAAGKGTRMKSPIPKVLHQIHGKSMLKWVIEALHDSGVGQAVVVIGGHLPDFSAVLDQYPGLIVCEQRQRRGTGDAVAAAAHAFIGVEVAGYSDGALLSGQPTASDYVLICAGDAPNLKSATIRDFCQDVLSRKADMAVIGMKHPSPHGYGRIVLDSQEQLIRIVEEKDADPETQKIDLCNTGVVMAKTNLLFNLLADLDTNNAQKEYYLTDCFGLAKERGKSVHVYQTHNWQGFEGVNSPDQLTALADIMRK